MKRLLSIIALISMAIFMGSCATTGPGQVDVSQYKPPVIKLVLFEVPQYDGFWYYAKAVKPTKGKEDDRGAPLPMSFLFSIENPNPFPLVLEGVNFTVAFDKDFDVVTVANHDTYLIPAQSKDHVRFNTMITVRSTFLSLMATGGFKLKAKNIDPWQALEKWWTKVPELGVPIDIKDGAFNFKVGKETKVVSFAAPVK